MTIILDQSTIFNLVHTAGYTSQSTSSFGVSDITSILTATLPVPMVKNVELNTTANVITTFNIYYKMQGWNPVTQVYETWHSMQTPLLTPPSGNTLQNIGVISSWKDR
jgi:hypothetical protein